MIRFHVPDMSCSHCSGVITKALKGLDPSADISFDMHNHLVQVNTSQPVEAVRQTLEDAGYPATQAA